MSNSAYDGALQSAFAKISDYVESLAEAPVAPTRDTSELRRRLGGPLPELGREPSRVVDDLAAAVDGGLMRTGSPRFFGWVMGGALPAALAADIVATAWDQNPAVHAMSPAAAVAEEVCGHWLLELLDLPRTSSFALVTGCQMAHVTCLAAARHALLARQGWDAEALGLFGAPPISVLAGASRHGTVDRALRLLGLGRRSIVEVACSLRGVLDVRALEVALRRDSAAGKLVVLQAGEVNTGSFDPFEAAIALARTHGAWVHIDGAFGLWARASSKYRDLTAGVDGADSWATDGHKWLNLPYDCGYAFVRDPAPHRAAFSHKAQYLAQSAEAADQPDRDAVDWTPDHSRRARAFATHAALRSLGRSGVDELVTRSCLLARDLVSALGSLPGVEVVHLPHLNQGLVRFPAPAGGASEAEHDRHTQAVIAAIARTGEAFFSSTTWQGRRCMRISVTNWRTTEQDVQRVCQAVERVLRAGAGHPASLLEL